MKRFNYAAGVAGMIVLATVLAIPVSARAEYHYYRGDCSIEYFIEQLRFAWDEDDREDAAKELGKIGDPRALPALRRAAAYDGDKGVRKKACKAIRRINEDYRDENRIYGDYPGYGDAYYRPGPARPVAYGYGPPYGYQRWRRRACWRP